MAQAAAIARRYSAHADVAAIIVGGSVARGWADAWSDLELSLFWRELPDAPVLQALASQAGGVQRRTFPGQPPHEALEEEWYLGRLKIDMNHRTIAGVDHVVEDVLHLTDPTWARQGQIATIRSGTVLHGHAQVEEWRGRTSYPDALARYMVMHHVSFGPQAWLEMLAERDDVPYLSSLYCEAQRHIVGVLLGLNHTYPPVHNLKWLPRVADELPIAPGEIGTRLRSVFRLEPGDGVRELGQLIDETISLVELHMPDIPTGHVRDRIAQRRTQWNAPEP